MDQLGYQTRSNFQSTSLVDPRLSSLNLLNPTYQQCTNFIELQEMQSQADQQYIENWLLEKGKLSCVSTEVSKAKKNEISISVAKKMLKNCVLIMEKLNETEEELRQNFETMSSAEWKQKTIDIGLLKDEFNKLILKFEDNTMLNSLRNAIKKRQKKRRNAKNRKLFQRQLLSVKNEKCQQIHKNIDDWLEGKKEEAEKVKMEEKLRKDADCVLYEVTKKKSDARKQLSLISALVKLRTVRESMAQQRGEKTSAEDRQAFGSVTEKLIRMWENQFQQYSQEEQNLKATLERNASADSKAAQLAKEQAIVDEWQAILFGVKDEQVLGNSVFWALTSAERDMETFVAIRKSWDTFLVDVNNKSASGIPLGWVVPSSDASDCWTNFLRR